MMILLSLIAVGLLSLSATTLRSANSNAFQQEARANARLGLQIALGQLQKTTGDDRSVTAPAAAMIPGAAQPHLVGAWDSWSWDPVTESSSPNYQEEKESRFRGWLTSQATSNEEVPDLAYAATLPVGETAPLFAEGTMGTASGEESIIAEMIPVLSEEGEVAGNFAWTVLSEDTKARVDLIRDESRPDDGEHLAASLTFPESYYQAALDIEGFEPENEEEWTRLVSSMSLDAAVGSGGGDSAAKNHFFDYTVYSRGVLSDVANGGLKRDLTTILEENLLDGQRVYSGDTQPFGVADPHWSYLSDYYNQYLNFQGDQATAPVDVTSSIQDLRGQRGYDSSDTSPETLTLKPVIAKLQIIFSMVTHPLELTKVGNWVTAYNTADPSFANQHLRAWLVFEPVVTLWNPYSVPIQFDSMSIGLDKIPVSFRFGKKSGRGAAVDMRVVEPQGARINRSFWPLSQFVWFGGKDDAITNFSFNIRGGDMDSGTSRDAIVLEPGENKIFSMLVRQGDSWGNVSRNFMIQGSGDVGAGSQGSLIKGVDMVEGYNDVGGFRFDHLGRNGSNREPASLYTFERASPINSGWHQVMVLRPQDSVTVKAKLANNDARNDQEVDDMGNFTMLVEMDQLGGIASDRTLGSSFTVQEKERLYEDPEDNPEDNVIERSYDAGGISQLASDTNRGGKEPFAVFTMSAKSTNELLSPTKGWLYGNPVLAAYEQDELVAPQPLQSYEFSFREIASADSFPMVEIDPQSNRGYFGSGQTAQTGLTASPMFSLPTTPMVSIGQFQAANLVSAVKPPFFNYPLGNSFAHPLLEPNQAVSGDFVDHSYLLNQRLWDSYYFSGISKGGSSDSSQALESFFEGDATLIPRLQPYQGRGQTVDEITANLTADSGTMSRELAGYQMLEGTFNIHSTSVSAWKALLMSAFEVRVPSRDNESHEVVDGTAFARLLPSYSEALNDLSSAGGSGDIGNDGLSRAERWLGYHQLTEEQCELLAQNIVEQIQEHCAEDQGPFLSFGEFVNRRVDSSDVNFTEKGVLQTAIDLTNDPNGSSAEAGVGVNGELFSLEDGVGIEDVDERVVNPLPLEGNTAEGSPATLIQGDLLQQIGSFISVRSDTFRIRSYGSSVAKNGEVQAEAWCEAIVQRVPDFVDSTQTPGTEVDQLNIVNQNFGRRFQVVSFRWLASQEV